MEFIIYNNAIAAAGIKKLSETPVTNFKYYTGDDELEGTTANVDSWKSILERSLNLKSKLLNISYNTLVYGNCFVSVYSPITRILVCNTCGERVSIKHAKNLKVFMSKPRSIENEEFYDEDGKKKSSDVTNKLKSGRKKKTVVAFSCYCETCHGIRVHSAKDYHSKSKDSINIVVWNPHDIEIASNTISGEEEFYYKVPQDLKTSIKNNDKLILATTPIPMIEAALSNNYFKFDNGTIYHSKREVVSGISTSWGMPALTAAIPAFLTLMILRKANEKIASDYMVPLRTIFPAQQSGPQDMYNYIGGTDFVHKINTMLNKWKLDPSAVQVTPFPVGVETILGDGKMLSLNQEIDQLESNIANALGIPIEFIKGGLSYTAQGSSLRLLENQLARLTSNLEDVIEFIVQKVARIMDKEPIRVGMIPFKIVDDLAEKSAIVQLAMSGPDKISAGTLFELFNLDAINERRRLENEQKEQIKQQLELQDYQQEVASSIEERAKSAAQMANNSFSNINQQALMQEAEMYVEQLLQMDEGTRRSQLDEMAKTNYILYGVVKALLEMKQNKEIYRAGKEAVKSQ